MKILNFIEGFSWASSVNEDNNAKVSICGESFWISDCQPTSIEGQPAVKGKIANNLMDTDRHGLNYGEEVIFVSTQE